MERFVDQDFSEAEFRECVFNSTRLIGVVVQDAEIDGLVSNLVVNGVEVSAYVEAELDRRHPVRVLIRSDVPSDLLEGWRRLQADWAATVARLRASPGMEQRGVNGEWSAIQTLRHLVFVHDSWFRRCILGSTALFTPMGLAIDVVPDRELQGLDLTADPTLDEVLAVRAEQAAELGDWLRTVTPTQLAAPAPIPDGDGWPPYARGRSTLRCLATVLNEEWAHHGFCVRDLDLFAEPDEVHL
jgi:DinB superfamily